MKLIKIIILTFIFNITFAQVNEMQSLAFNYADFYLNDTVNMSTVKTYTNVDVFNNGHFIILTSHSNRIYHYLLPNTPMFDINRLVFKRNLNSYYYNPTFKIFNDSIYIQSNCTSLKFINKDKSIEFYNK